MNISSSDGFLQFELDDGMLKAVQDALGTLKGDTGKVLKNAVNATARKAKKQLADKAKETYAVQQSRFTKAMKQRNATAANPTATIEVTGKQLELKDFEVSPDAYNPQSPPDIVRARVLLSSSLKDLKSNTKAFLVSFTNKSKNGSTSTHLTVAQRKGKGRFPIKKLLSNSVPKMVGSQERVYGIIEPQIYDTLMENIQKQIQKAVK